MFFIGGFYNMNESLYSVLWFTPELDEYIFATVEKYIQTGRKVYLLSYDDPEAFIENNTLLMNASSKYLLNSYIVKYHEKIANKEYIISDGVVADLPLLDLFDSNSTFNKEQYVLEHQLDLHHSLVKAGAGTGKTTTMINRVSFLKHYYRTLSLKEIVMITFTNDAAIHMRSKLMEKWKDYYEVTRSQQYLAWLEEVNDMFIGTIHSFAKEFLVIEGSQFGFSPFLEIRSYRHRQRKLVEKYIDKFSTEHREIYRAFRFIPQYKVVQTFIKMLERIHNKAISYKDMLEINYGFDCKDFSIFAKYVIQNVEAEILQLKQQEGTLEIHDLISRLSEFRHVRPEQLNMKINYLFVDEFQDTDEAQVSFTSWLVDRYNCYLFAVGDIKQSIYRFRGADYTAFKQIGHQLDLLNKQHKTYSIQKNYRSSKRLIKQFNQLFNKWDDSLKQFQFEKNDEIEAVLEDKDSDGLVTMNISEVDLRILLKRFYGKDVVFLTRSNRQLLETVKQIERMGFFCEAETSGAFYRSVAVREFYLLIRRLTHPNLSSDRYAFNLSSYSSNQVSINEVLSHFNEEKPYVLELLNKVEGNDLLEKEKDTNSLLNRLEKIAMEIDPANRYRLRFYQDTKLRYPNQQTDILKDEAIFQYKEYKANLEKLFFILKKEFISDVAVSLYDIEKFLAIKMATDNSEIEWKSKDTRHKRFKVMTVHKAKGLEFDTVILLHTDMSFLRNNYTDTLLVKNKNQWNFGYKVHWKEMDFQNDIYTSNIIDENDETIAEETRLLYVALTRAKKTVIANSSNSMNLHKIQSWNNLLESGETLRV